MAEGSYSRVPEKRLHNDLNDLKRRMAVVERYAGAGGGGGGGGGAVVNEVWIGTEEPTDPAIELWYDPDAPVAAQGLGYVHNQGVAATVWTINHPLQFQPNVSVVDSAGDQVEGTVHYVSSTQLTVSFSAAFTGVAYLS
jgi:hypothetical protein